MTRRMIIAALAGVTVFGSVFAMAASLGGVSSSKIGADNVAVGSCDSDGVSTSYRSAWDATDKRYEISAVTVSGVNDACDGQTLSVSLTDASGGQIGTGNAAIPSSASTSFSVSLGTAASAKLAEGVHVLITS